MNRTKYMDVEEKNKTKIFLKKLLRTMSVE